MKLVLLLAVTLVVVVTGQECDYCKDPDFDGFGFKPTKKCGCCPWPCNCTCKSTELERPPCEALLEMVFVMDASGSIGSNWGIAKQFVVDVARSLTNLGTDQRMAMVTFSSNATLEWNFLDSPSDSFENTEKAIMALPLQGFFTNTEEALQIAIDILNSDQNDPRKPNIVVVMTDGRANFNVDRLPATAAKLKQLAEVTSIGVTSQVAKEELDLISTRKSFTVTEFGALETIIRGITKEICPDPILDEKCFCCCTPEQFWAGGGASFYRTLKLL